jgi:Mpv17 / PMP22 family
MAGPGGHFWYGILSRWFPGPSLWNVSRRVIADQLLYNPPYMFIWLSAFWYMEDPRQFDSWQHYGDKMSAHFPAIICANWTLWFPAQAFNFRFVPMPFQVLATDCFDLLWSAYLSYSTSEMRKEEEQDDDGDNGDESEGDSGGRRATMLVHRNTVVFPTTGHR